MSPLLILGLSLAVSLVVTIIGFKKTVWFISIGYTMAIICMSIFTIVISIRNLQIYNYLQIILLMIWGGRLGFFLIRRESDKNYDASVKSQTDASQEVSLAVKAGIWISTSVLYVCMFSPAVFTLQPLPSLSLMATITLTLGLLVMATGVTMEALADSQKAAFKRVNPKTFCNAGLYRWVRCPNYLGEIMVWTGNFICAVTFFSSWWQWIYAATGLICIVLIMMGSAKRLEKKQSQSYGKDPEFQKYEKSVPILLPWVPLYSLQKVKVYLE